jgi:hypothetical protein
MLVLDWIAHRIRMWRVHRMLKRMAANGMKNPKAKRVKVRW